MGKKELLSALPDRCVGAYLPLTHDSYISIIVLMLRRQRIGIRVSVFQLTAAAVLICSLTGCGKKKPQITARIPAPPTIEAARNPQPSVPTATARDDRKVLYTETGIASWYGPPYHNRKAANGEVFDMNQPTAAHKTLPLNSLVRVTNLKTGRSTLVRITDRGPFVGDRILDLSMAAAKLVDVYRAGLATVKIELLETPAPLDTGGRWCVQIGAFTDSEEALRLKSKLMHKYQTAKVIEFTGPTGEWVRIRPAQDDRRKAFEMARDVRSAEGGVFLVRLD